VPRQPRDVAQAARFGTRDAVETVPPSRWRRRLGTDCRFRGKLRRAVRVDWAFPVAPCHARAVLDDPQRRWTKLAAVVIGIPICLLTQDLKPGPTGALLLVIAMLGGATWKQSGAGSTLLRRAILAAAVWLSVTIVAYTVLVRLYPPVDEAGHRFMPMGQITAAFGVATAVALAALAAMYRPLRTNPREESVGLAILWLIAIAGLVAHLAGLW